MYKRRIIDETAWIHVTDFDQELIDDLQQKLNEGFNHIECEENEITLYKNRQETELEYTERIHQQEKAKLLVRKNSIT